MRHTRLKASFAACVTAIGCMAMDDATHGNRDDAAPDEAVAAMRQRVREEAHALRASLDAAEAGRDWGELLERKRSVDGWLAPMHMVRDAMRAAAPGAACDLLAAWRVEWRDAPVREEWSHPDGAALARRALDAWVPRPGSGEAVRIEAMTSGERWVGCDAPATCAWTVDGSWGGDGPVAHGRCWWRFPLAEPVRVDLPLAGDGMDLWWDDRGARYQDDRGASHREAWPARPIFCNPPGMFAAFDSLRAAAAPDARCEAGAGQIERLDAGESHDTVAPTHGVPHIERTRVRTVRRADGSAARVDRWTYLDGVLREVRIRIEPLSLEHRFERAFRLVHEVDGVHAEGHEHRPVSAVTEFPDGCEALISFRTPVASVDATRPGATTAPSVPDQIEFRASGETIGRARFVHVRLGLAHLPDPFVESCIDVRRTEGEAHRERAAALDRAILLADRSAIRDAVGAVMSRHDASDTDEGTRLDERSLIHDRLAAIGLDDVGRADAADAAASPEVRARPRAARAPCGDRPLAELAEAPRVQPAAARNAAKVPDPCAGAGEAALGLARCAAEALASTSRNEPWFSCIRAAICRAEPWRGGNAVDDRTAHRLARDLADGLRLGAIVLSDGPDADEDCAAVAEALKGAATREPPEPEAIARACAAFDAAREGCRRALRSAIAAAAVASELAAGLEAEFDQVAAVRRAMLGNAFGDARSVLDGAPYDPMRCLAAAESDAGIRRALLHELARAEALRAAAGPLIGDARLRAAPGRVAAAAMRSLEGAMRSGLE